jgi:hypothetical protein
MFEPSKNYKSLMSPVIRIYPSIRNVGIEKLCHQTIWINVSDNLLFQHASPLKFGKTF